jgi:hypothetical protein
MVLILQLKGAKWLNGLKENKTQVFAICKNLTSLAKIHTDRK